MDASSTSAVGSSEPLSERIQLDELEHWGEAALRHERLWFALYLAWLVGLTVAALEFLSRTERGVPDAQGLWLLALLCFYLSLCNALLPLPTAWIVLYAASPAAGLFQTTWLRVTVVASAAAAATVMANLNEYHVLAVLLRYGLGRRVRRTRVYRRAVRWFDEAPFLTLVLAALVPIPIDAIRWLAILRQYSRVRFALAYFVGRLLRYAVLALVAVWVELTPFQIALIQFVLVAAAACARLLRRPRTALPA